MNRVSLKKILGFSNIQLVRWMCNPRMILIIVFAVFSKIMIISPLNEIANRLGEKPTIFEPFISVSSSGLALLIFPLVFIVLISDYPAIYSDSYFSINRIGRCNWFIGQIVLAVYSIIVYIFATMLIDIVFSVRTTSMEIKWSNIHNDRH